MARPLWENEEEGKVVSIIGKFMDVHEERLQMNRLKKLAEQDPLTKLHNQASAKKTVSKALDTKERIPPWPCLIWTILKMPMIGSAICLGSSA